MASSHRIHFFHLIWSTKGRQNFILPKMEDRLYSYMGGIIRKSGGTLLEIGGIANHVHLLVELSNLDRFTSLIRNTKASSSSWLKQEFPECRYFAWQDGYGSYSVSYSQIEKVRCYIKQQKDHHNDQTFEQEYLKFLKMCNAQYDERYVFDELDITVAAVAAP